MQLAKFILNNVEPIAREWEEFANAEREEKRDERVGWVSVSNCHELRNEVEMR
jgi:hypothetical protein